MGDAAASSAGVLEAGECAVCLVGCYYFFVGLASALHLFCARAWAFAVRAMSRHVTKELIGRLAGGRGGDLDVHRGREAQMSSRGAVLYRTVRLVAMRIVISCQGWLTVSLVLSMITFGAVGAQLRLKGNAGLVFSWLWS